MYDSLAGYYDLFMDGIQYEKWIDYAAQFLKPGSFGADLGCGTGKFTVGLIKRGFKVYGVDISPQMLWQAEKNAKKEMLSAEFILGDMTSFNPPHKLDFITAMCDALNYIKSPFEMFKNVHSALKNSGLFVFDISTEYKLKNILANNTYSDTTSGVTYIWNNCLDAKKTKVDMELTFFEKRGDVYIKTEEKQTQYIHSADNIKALLKKAGFEKIEVYSGLTRRSVKDCDERIHFIAFKQQSE